MSNPPPPKAVAANDKSVAVSRSIAFSRSYSRCMSADVIADESPPSGSTDADRRGVCDGVIIMLGGAKGYGETLRSADEEAGPLPFVSGDASREP
jgi:hypothetical protein